MIFYNQLFVTKTSLPELFLQNAINRNRVDLRKRLNFSLEMLILRAQYFILSVHIHREKDTRTEMTEKRRTGKTL